MHHFLRSNSLLFGIPTGDFQHTNCSMDVVLPPRPGVGNLFQAADRLKTENFLRTSFQKQYLATKI